MYFTKGNVYFLLFSLRTKANTNRNTWLLSDLHGGVVPTPNPPTAPSIQRRWFYDPIYNTSSPNMTCNYDGAASLSPLHAPIKAGGEIFTNWTNPSYYSWPDDWQHTVGPMFAYMAACPGESCEGFDGSGAVWFKIDQQGLTPDAPDLRGMWEQRPAINQNWNEREGYTVTIPKNLKPGNYLIRHEVIMLVSVQAQIYPSCAQLSVSGDGAAVPGDEYLVSFPGAYSPEGNMIL